MSDPQPILSLVTIGVTDLKRSVSFYEARGFRRKAKGNDGVAFFEAGACTLALFPAGELAKDANIASPEIPGNFRGVSLAWNCKSQADVDAAFKRAAGAGAVVIKSPEKVFWGGYSGYFTDLDGHLWEIAHNPLFPLDVAGRLTLPD
jgi:catechol 2,3-dioxygenase-like lactoylglutathione lyase family enzyme